VFSQLFMADDRAKRPAKKRPTQDEEIQLHKNWRRETAQEEKRLRTEAAEKEEENKYAYFSAAVVARSDY
jgi:hypothetical protein